MSVRQTQTEFVHPGFRPTNSSNHPVVQKALDLSACVATTYKMERDGNGIKIVETGKVDRQAEIQSQSCNAGLQNIIRLQTMRYGTIENAIARNAEKQIYADVSNVPLSVAEQAEAVAANDKDVQELCSKLGISKDELLSMSAQSLAQKFADLNKTQIETQTETHTETQTQTDDGGNK